MSSRPTFAACTELLFKDGRCVGMRTPGGSAYTVRDLVALDLLSLSDRLILERIAARVDQVGRALSSHPQRSEEKP